MTISTRHLGPLTWVGLNRNKTGIIDGYLKMRESYEAGTGADLALEVSRGKRLAASFTVGGEETDLSIQLAFGWSVYLTLRGFVPWSWRRWLTKRAEARVAAQHAAGGRKRYAYELDLSSTGRTTGVRVFDGTIWFDLWKDTSQWSNDDAKHWPWNAAGWEWSWGFVRAFLGRIERVDGETSSMEGFIEAPEGRYPATATVTPYRLRRSKRLGRILQWFEGSPTRMSVVVAIPNGGPPHPGKGTTGYNCGDDCTFTLSWSTDMPDSFASIFRIAADKLLRTREQRCGPGWVPHGGWPDHMIPREPS